MKIHLRDLNEALVTAWGVWISDNPVKFGFTTMDGAVGDPADAGAMGIVSPANSFGFMDGGIDLAYARRWPGLESAVRDHIKRYCRFGEILVGQALGIPIPGCTAGNSKPGLLIVAPTMRVPMRIADPADVYLATRAAVRCAHDHDLESLAMPGMGTGCGAIPPELAANAMMRGIRDAITAPELFPPEPKSMGEASRMHWEFQRR